MFRKCLDFYVLYLNAVPTQGSRDFKIYSIERQDIFLAYSVDINIERVCMSWGLIPGTLFVFNQNSNQGHHWVFDVRGGGVNQSFCSLPTPILFSLFFALIPKGGGGFFPLAGTLNIFGDLSKKGQVFTMDHQTILGSDAGSIGFFHFLHLQYKQDGGKEKKWK